MTIKGLPKREMEEGIQKGIKEWRERGRNRRGMKEEMTRGMNERER